MAKLTASHVLRYPSGGLPGPDEYAAHNAQLRAAHRPMEIVRGWRESRMLALDDAPGFHVLEQEAVTRAGARTAPGSYRALLGMLEPEVSLVELEEDSPRAPPVFPVPALAADDQRVLGSLLEEVALGSAPTFELTLSDRRVRVWSVGVGEVSRRMVSALADVPVRPLRALPGPGNFLSAIIPLSEPGLVIRPIHRALRGVTTFQPDRFLTLVTEYAKVVDLDTRLDAPRGLALAREQLATLSTGTGNHGVLAILPGGVGKLLRFKQGLNLSQVPAAPRSPTLRSLDLALLNALVLKTVVGVSQPEQVGHPNVFTIPTLEALVEGVGSGQFQVGFGLNPPPTWELRAVMEAEQRLPPRTLALELEPPEGVLFFLPES